MVNAMTNAMVNATTFLGSPPLATLRQLLHDGAYCTGRTLTSRGAHQQAAPVVPPAPALSLPKCGAREHGAYASHARRRSPASPHPTRHGPNPRQALSRALRRLRRSPRPTGGEWSLYFVLR